MSEAPVPLVALVTTDFSGTTRGRAIPAAAYEDRPGRTVGWVPANQALTPFDTIPADNPWGSTGDLRLLPDPAARYRCWPPGAGTPFDVVMCDIVELDGAPWSACARSMLRRTLADLASETGLRLVAAFEHEFQLVGEGAMPAPAFSLRALRAVDPFGPALVAALAAAGLRPETFLREYGRSQFEVTVAPAEGVRAADDAVALREIVRELARLHALSVSFAPKTAMATGGNGVHIHLSFLDAEDRPALYDPARPGRLSAVGGAFFAGILRHMPAIVAVTAPSPASYLRLRPHNWSASRTWLGERDREASLRICPTVGFGGRNPARGFNVEFRAADAAASPHLALAVLAAAGLAGLRDGLAPPPIFSGDPEALDEAERERLGLRPLPGSLAEALDALAADPVLADLFGPAALATYLGMKRAEIAAVAGFNDDALCSTYAAIY